MVKEDLLKLLFLTDNTLEEQENITSTVKLLIYEARELSGRNFKTGIYDNSDLDDFDSKYYLYNSRRFNGLFLYLILLEVIGSLVNLKSNPNSQNGIKRALTLFSDKIIEENHPAIVGLRNSLAHRFSLSTESKPKQGKPLCFELIWGKSFFIVENPITDWDGDFDKKGFYTKIGVENLINHIEEIYNNVNEKLDLKELISIPEISELKARYTIKN